jgi:hypothetical protein
MNYAYLYYIQWLEKDFLAWLDKWENEAQSRKDIFRAEKKS